jgi:hypothetical protein
MILRGINIFSLFSSLVWPRPLIFLFFWKYFSFLFDCLVLVQVLPLHTCLAPTCRAGSQLFRWSRVFPETIDATSADQSAPLSALTRAATARRRRSAVPLLSRSKQGASSSRRRPSPRFVLWIGLESPGAGAVSTPAAAQVLDSAFSLARGFRIESWLILSLSSSN